MAERIYVSRGCPSSGDWEALLRGDLPPDRVDGMEAHLGGCPLCLAVLDGLTPSLPAALSAEVRAPGRASSRREAAWHLWAESRPPAGSPHGDPHPFERAGRYRSEGLIDSGGMGEVYRAWEFALERHVAIKILPARARCSAAAVARLKAEVLRLARLEHPNIVRVYAADEQGGIPFFAMELLRGQTLARANRDERIPPRRAAELVRLIAKAIHHAHEQGIFHLDLKPANIFLTADGIPKVGDFGLAAVLDGAAAGPGARGAGTPAYMAPEQWVDGPEALDARTDVYGLGAILYELLAGRPPFPGTADRAEARRQALFDRPRRPRDLPGNGPVPRDLELICNRCLSKRPGDRYATALDLADALDRFLGGYPVADCSPPRRLGYLVRRHRRLAMAACAGLLLIASALGVTASATWQRQRTEARMVFDEGRRWAAEGRITEGYRRMQEAIGLLPVGESELRGYFSRSVETRKAGLVREVASRSAPAEFTAAAASPDGRHVLLGELDGTTTLWDLADDTSRPLPARGRRPVTAVAFDRTGALCAAGGYDCVVRVWEVGTGRVLREYALDYYVRCLAFLGEGQRLLTGSADPGRPLRVWELAEAADAGPAMEASAVLREPPDELVTSPRGDRFLSIAGTGRCLLWDAEAGRVIADLSEGPWPVRPRAAFSVDGGRLAVAGAELIVHDGRTGATLRRAEAGRWDRTHCVGFRDDGGVSLVVEAGRGVALRRGSPDLATWDDAPLDRPGHPDDLATWAGRGLVLTGLGTKTVRLLQPPPLALRHADLGDEIARAQVVASADGSRIATLTRPRWNPDRPVRGTDLPDRPRLQVWDGRTLRALVRDAELPAGDIAEGIAFGPAADTIAVGCGPRRDGSASVLVGTLGPDGALTFARLGSQANGVRRLAFTPDGRHLVSGSLAVPGGEPAALTCWDLRGGSGPLWSVSLPAAATAVAVSPTDGQIVAVGGMDGQLRLVRMDRPRAAHAPIDVGAPVTAVAFSPDASLIAAAHLSGVSLFEVTGPGDVRRLPFDQPGTALEAVAFGPVGMTLYARGDGGIRRWDVRALGPLDPVIPFVDGVIDFGLIPRPEAVIAVTDRGQLILRSAQ